jgi:hypothetical protein
MLVSEFEELARHTARSMEGARLEFINGHLGGGRPCRTAITDASSGG